MSSFFLNYCFYMSIAGVVVLLILSILAFVNLESLKIKEGKHTQSGIILIITAIVLYKFTFSYIC